MIKAVNITKTYHQGGADIKAVQKASLEICRKEAILITGPSGAGKSTLLHLLGGLEKPTKGILFFEGIEFYKLSDRARSAIRNEKIGFVFQFYHLLPEFTVLENVMLPALMRRGPKREEKAEIRRRAATLLEKVGLGKRISHRPSELSGGELQRAAIARSLINNPFVLFCDEPVGNLDSKVGQEIIESLWRLKEEENMALVIVTHDKKVHENFDKSFKIEDGYVREDHGEDRAPAEEDLIGQIKV